MKISVYLTHPCLGFSLCCRSADGAVKWGGRCIVLLLVGVALVLLCACVCLRLCTCVYTDRGVREERGVGCINSQTDINS